MGVILTLILGGLAGWIASAIVGRNNDMGIVANIVVGIVGAFLSNWLLAPLFDSAATLSTFSLSGFFMSVLGAVLLLVIVNLFTKRRPIV